MVLNWDRHFGCDGDGAKRCLCRECVSIGGYQSGQVSGLHIVSEDIYVCDVCKNLHTGGVYLDPLGEC